MPFEDVERTRATDDFPVSMSFTRRKTKHGSRSKRPTLRISFRQSLTDKLDWKVGSPIGLRERTEVLWINPVAAEALERERAEPSLFPRHSDAGPDESQAVDPRADVAHAPAGSTGVSALTEAA